MFIPSLLDFSEKRVRRTKSAKASFAGRTNSKPVDPILEGPDDVTKTSETNDEGRASSLDTEAGASSQDSQDEASDKHFELENENMEDYLARMTGLISKMVWSHTLELE